MAEKDGAVAVNDRDADDGKQMEFESFTVGDKEGTIKPDPEPTEGVEIEIPDETAEAADKEGDTEVDVDPKVDSKPTAPKAGDKRPNKVPSGRRIAQLTAEKYALAEEAARERAEVARLRAENEQLNRAAMMNYEQNVDAKIERAKQKLRDARNTGDMDAETDAQLELSQAAAEKNDVEAWKRKNPAPQPGQQQQRPQGQPQADEPYRLNPNQMAAIQGWMAENPWFDDRNKEEFDPDMRKDVQAYAASVESYLIKQGRAADIATPQYFKLINDYVKKHWPADGEDDNGPDMTAPTGGVAPVSKSAGGPANAGVRQSGGKTVVSLTAAERDMAHRLDMRWPNGKSYSPQEKELAYARNKLKLAKK